MTNDTGYTPTGDLVLMTPYKVQEKIGKIALPETAQERHQKAVRVGTIIATGEQALKDPRMQGISVGDQVLFARYAADELPINGVGYFVMRASSVMGRVTKLPDYELGGAQSSVETFGVNTP